MIRTARTLALLALVAAGPAAAAGPSISGAWARATPPGARTAAAYLTIVDDGTGDRLLAATTRAAGRVELHTHATEAGMSRMARVAEIAVPAGGTVRLEPGGMHLMLLDLEGPLVAGTIIELTLTFASAGNVAVAAPVVDARAAPAEHAAH